MKKLFFGLVVIAVIVFGFLSPTALAASSDACNLMINKSSICSGGSSDGKNIAKNIVEILAWAVGSLSVIFIVWAGIQYVISAGDSGKINRAKTTLIYAVVGLIVAVMAGAIVNYVLSKA